MNKRHAFYEPFMGKSSKCDKESLFIAEKAVCQRSFETYTAQM